MMIKKRLRNLMTLVGIVAAVPIPAAQAADPPIPGKVHESRFHIPFPVQKAGEKIDVLVRVDKTDRAYGFYLILVEEKSWPIQKKEALQRLYYGWMVGDVAKTPYPIRVRLLIDSIDPENGTHIDEIVAERSPSYGELVNEGRQTWRAEALYLGRLPKGVYRVRLENLSAVPQIEFSTLFAFERDSRKY